MNFKKFNKLFDILLNSKEKRRKIFRELKEIKKNCILSNIEFLNFIKILIIVSFYESNKFHKIHRLLLEFNLLSKSNKRKLLNLLYLFDFNKISNNLINKIILRTFYFLNLLDDKNLYFIFTNILNCINEVENYSVNIKLKIYVQIINQSINNIKNKYSINNLIDHYKKTIKIIKQN